MPAFYSSRALFSFARYIVMHDMFVLMVNVIFSCIDVEIITIQDTALLYIQNIFYYFFSTHYFPLAGNGWWRPDPDPSDMCAAAADNNNGDSRG